MPYRYEGERLVFDARTPVAPEATTDPDASGTLPLPGLEPPAAAPRRLVFTATDDPEPGYEPSSQEELALLAELQQPAGDPDPDDEDEDEDGPVSA